MVHNCLIITTPRGLPTGGAPPRGLLAKNVPPERFLNAQILIKSQVLYQLS